jgi:hypothetical protein
LIGFQNPVEILADRLILDVSENEAALGDLEIGCALSDHALWFVVDADSTCADVRNRLQEGLEHRPICVLGLFLNRCLKKIKEIEIQDILNGHYQVLRVPF